MYKCISLGYCLFVGQVMFSHHSDQMSLSLYLPICSTDIFSLLARILHVLHAPSAWFLLGDVRSRTAQFTGLVFSMIAMLWCSQLWEMSKISELWDCHLKVFSKCICHCFFLGQVMFSHHFEQTTVSGQLKTIESFRWYKIFAQKLPTLESWSMRKNIQLCSLVSNLSNLPKNLGCGNPTLNL